MAMLGKVNVNRGAGAGAGRGSARVRDWVPEGRVRVTPGGRGLQIWLAMLLRGVVESKVARANRIMEQQA